MSIAYRELKIGDVTEEGDERLNIHRMEWQPAKPRILITKLEWPHRREVKTIVTKSDLKFDKLKAIATDLAAALMHDRNTSQTIQAAELKMNALEKWKGFQES
jgi:hypothetical protein